MGCQDTALGRSQAQRRRCERDAEQIRGHGSRRGRLDVRV